MPATSVRRSYPLGTALLVPVLLLLAAPPAGADVVAHTSPQPTPVVVGRETVSLADDDTVPSAGSSGQAVDEGQGTAVDDTGRHVVFTSTSPGLVPGEDGVAGGVFVRDRATGTTERVSRSTDGRVVDPGASHPAVSGDGRVVVFQSSAALTAAGTGGSADLPVVQVYAHDRAAGTTRLVSARPDGAPAAQGCTDPDVSRDGRFVVCESGSADLVPGDTNQASDVFRFDLATGARTRVSTTSAGGQLAGSSRDGSVSQDGRHVAYWSVTSAPGVFPARTEVFRWDAVTGGSQRVSVAEDGGAVQGGRPRISDDGDVVAFETDDPAAGAAFRAVAVRTVSTSRTVLASGGPSGRPADADVRSLSLSGDGSTVAFASDATNLTVLEEQAGSEAFVHDLRSGVTSRLTSWGGGDRLLGGGPSSAPVLARDGRTVVLTEEDEARRTRALLLRVDLALSSESAASVFVPSAPVRVVERLRLPAGRGGGDARRTVDLSRTAARPPAGTVAVVLNLTVSDVRGATFVTACPSGLRLDDCRSSSTVNAAAGADTANLTVVRLGGPPGAAPTSFDLYADSSPVLASADLVGYLVDARSAPAGAQGMAPQAPVRLAAAPRVTGGSSVVVPVPGVPADATAVLLRTTVAGVRAGTYVSVCPTAQALPACRGTSTLNAQAGRDTSNLSVVPLGRDRTVRVYVDAGAVTTLFDVVGFVRPVAVSSLLVPTTPVRWGSRVDNGPTLPMTALPDDASGLFLNVTGSAVSQRMYVSVCPYGDPVGCARTSVLNLYAGEDRAAGTVVGLSPDDPPVRPPSAAWSTSGGSVRLLFDVLGYLVPSEGRLGG